MEAVQGLLERRKHLHVCTMEQMLEETKKLLLEKEAALEGSQAHVMSEGGVLKDILDEFDNLLVDFGQQRLEWYLDDEQMKQSMEQAIDFKKHAVLKHSVAVEHVVRGSWEGVLEHIRVTPIEDMRDGSEVLRLRSGVLDFPWKAVCDHAQEEIRITQDLEVWQASMLWECIFGLSDTVQSVRFSNSVLTDWSCPILNLANMRMGPSGACVVAGLLENNKSITSVCLPGNDIGPHGAVALCTALAGLTGLQELDLADNLISGDVATNCIVAAIANNRGIQNLNLRGNRLTFAHGLQLHGVLKTCPEITDACGLPMQGLRCDSIDDLDLQFKGMGPVEAALAIESLKTNTSVKRLDLAGMGMGHQGAVQLVSLLETSTTLTTLDMRLNHLTYEDGLLLLPCLLKPQSRIRSISGLPLARLRDGSMQELSLRTMNCGPAEGAIAISVLGHCTQLVKLSLFGVGIGKRGMGDLMLVLKKSQSLQLIDLRENGLEKEQAMAMMRSVEHLPNLQHLCGIPIDGLKKGTVKKVNLENLFIGEGESSIILQVLKGNSSVRHLNLRGAFVKDADLPDLLSFVTGNVNLKHIDLRDNELSHESGIALIEKCLPSLEVISGVPVVDIRTNAVKALDLGGMDIGALGSSITVHMLRYNTSITSLKLVSCNLGPWAVADLAEFLKESKGLTALDLRGNDFSLPEGLLFLDALGDKRMQVTSFGEIPLAGMLRNEVFLLDLKGALFGAAEAGLLCSALKVCSSLTSLDLSDNGYAGADAVESLIDALASSRQLKRLDLRGNGLTAKEGEALMLALDDGTGLESMCGLEVSRLRDGSMKDIDLYFHNMGPMEGVVLGKLLLGKGFIETLDLTRNFLGPDGCSALAPALKSLTMLQELGLGCNRIGELGAVALSEGLRHLTSLERLYLYENNLGPKGSVAIAGALKHTTNLAQLYLSYNRMGDAGCSALSGTLPLLSTMQCIGLQNNNIGTQGWTDFATALNELSLVKYVNIQGHQLESEDMVGVKEAIRRAMFAGASDGGEMTLLYM